MRLATYYIHYFYKIIYVIASGERKFNEHEKKKVKVLPGIEPGLPESESGVITITL